jgi:hypothetical protein
MVQASRSTTLRRAGAFLALVGFEVGAVVVLHRLGELPWLRVPFDDLEGWLQTSAPEDVLAAAVRLVALAAAWWLLGSTALYVLARLSRIPGAISALERVTLPSVRRLADQAIAFTLATSIIGGGANAALASPAGIPRREAVVVTHDPLSAWTRTSTLGSRSAPATTEPPTYQPQAAGPGKPGYQPGSAAGPGRPSHQPGSAAGPGRPGHRPEPAGGASTPGYRPEPAGRAAPDAAGATPSPTSPPPRTSPTRPAATTSPPPSSTVARPPAPPGYTPRPAGPPGRPAPVPQMPPGEAGLHHVALGDNLWTIARDRLAEVTGRPAAGLSEREIARYWLDVVDANRASLRSGDPDLIFPGELIRLPPVTRQEP